MPQSLYKRNNPDMIFAGITCYFLHFSHSKCPGYTNFRMAWIVKLITPFPYQHIDLVPCQVTDKIFDVSPGVLVIKVVIMDCTDWGSRPIHYFHAFYISSGCILLNK